MKRKLVLDIEIYSNYLLVMFKSVDTRRVRYFEQHASSELDVQTILGILREYTVVTFNGIDFDLPLLFMALNGASVAEVKVAANRIINENLRGWQFTKQYGIDIPRWVDHIDLREPVPGVQISLKLYGGRLHSKKLQDLPIDPYAEIEVGQRRELRTYCENDLDTTIDLWLKATDPKDDIIATRELLSAEFGVDMRSKSDAQIAEAAIKAKVSKALGGPVYPQEVAPGTTFRYRAPQWMVFRDPVLKAKFEQILAAHFVVNIKGKVDMPACLRSKKKKGASGETVDVEAPPESKVTFAGKTYTMGIGGLHSTEHRVAHVAGNGYILRDTDVVSFYPALILLCGLFPRNMGEHFQRVYREFFTRRIAAKKAGHKSTAQTLKIVLNGSFGKLGSAYSVLYSPDLLIQVTVTGQLALLMLIERLEGAGIQVVSANTDGIVQKCPAHLDDVRRGIIARWEKDTGLDTEDVGYRALYSRDVNNYIALKEGGGVKTKGVFADPGVQKNPDNVIVGKAVCDLLDKGVPIGETIVGCQDLRQFLTVQRVTGGAQVALGTRMCDDWRQEGDQWVMRAGNRVIKKKRKSRPGPELITGETRYLGKVVRWYRSTRGVSHIERVTNGNKVPCSDSAMPCMDLPDTFPDDIDHGWYIAEAHKTLREIGALL